MKIARLEDYLEKRQISVFSVSMVSEILYEALTEGISELLLTRNEFNIIERYMVYSGMWDWDKKTFMGIEFVIVENT